MNWKKANGEEITELGEDVFGFIYQIYYKDGTKYIGKKQIRSVRKVPKNKKELEANKDGRTSKKKTVIKENKWRDYIGSSKYSAGRDIEKKEIIKLCQNKWELTYFEVYYQFLNNVLFDDNYLNANVLGRFYIKKDQK